MERLCNKLARVERLLNFREPIAEAYFPKLDSLVSSRGWPARVAHQRIQNLRRESDQLSLDIDDLERWRQRVYDAIHSASVMDVRKSTYKQNQQVNTQCTACRIMANKFH